MASSQGAGPCLPQRRRFPSRCRRSFSRGETLERDGRCSRRLSSTLPADDGSVLAAVAVAAAVFSGLPASAAAVVGGAAPSSCLPALLGVVAFLVFFFLALLKGIWKVEFGVQDPGVPLPDGVSHGSAPQHIEVTQEQVQRLEEDGVVIVPGALKDWVDFLRAVTDDQMEHPHLWKVLGSGGDGTYKYIQRNMWMTNLGFRDFMYYSALGSTLGKLAGSPEVRLATDTLLVNPSAGLSWHQDIQNGPIAPRYALRWWVALDACGGADGNGVPEFLLGSHRSASVPEATSMVDIGSGDLPQYSACTRFRPQPGDLIVWNTRTVHRLQVTAGIGQQRRAFGGTVALAGATFEDRGRASAISDLAEHDLEVGDVLAAPAFPRVYPARVDAEEAAHRRGDLISRSPKRLFAKAASLLDRAMSQEMQKIFTGTWGSS